MSLQLSGTDSGKAINVSLAFCMGNDIEGLMNSDQPMAQIFFNSFGQKGTLAIWVRSFSLQIPNLRSISLVRLSWSLYSTFWLCSQTFESSHLPIHRYMMGSSMVLAASRQTFAFSRDGALPFSRWLYRMNSFTKTPVNTVSLLNVRCDTTYVLKASLIGVVRMHLGHHLRPPRLCWRWCNQCDLLTRCHRSLHCLLHSNCCTIPRQQLFPARTFQHGQVELTYRRHGRSVDDLHGYRVLVPYVPTNELCGYELHGGSTRRRHDAGTHLLLFPEVRWCTLVHWTCA